MTANIKDVAKQAGVSISTVSRVMNSTKNVSTELRIKVERAIEELGYSANDVARGLKISETKKIGVIITSLSRTFFIEILEGITKEAEKAGYQLLIAESHDLIEREMDLVNSFASQWVDGIILASSAYGKDRRTRQYVEKLSHLEKKGRRIPVVVLEFEIGNPDLDYIVVDHEKAAFEAVSHLIEDAGKQNIIHIGLPPEHIMGQQRIRGYKKALTSHGLPVQEENIIEGDYTSYFGYKIVEKMIQQGKKFDGIFCANDQMAVGALKACEEYGIAIPEEVAIIGNDDIFATELVKPALSTIHVPKREIGTAAMVRMLELLEGRRNSKSNIIKMDTRIIARGSTIAGAKSSLKDLNW